MMAHGPMVESYGSATSGFVRLAKSFQFLFCIERNSIQTDSMPDDVKALEHELAELVKRSRALSVEMSEISERMLELSAEITKRQHARAMSGKGKDEAKVRG